MISDYKASLPTVVVGKPLVDGQGQEEAWMQTNRHRRPTEPAANSDRVVPEPGLAVENRVVSEDLEAIALHNFLDHIIDAADRIVNS